MAQRRASPQLLAPAVDLLAAQGVLDVADPVPLVLPVRGRGRGRRWGRRRRRVLGRRLGPCCTPLPLLAAREGARMLRGPAWQAAVATVGYQRGLRCDSAARLAAMASALVAAAQGGATSAPTWARLAQAVGCARRTVARWLGWLRDARLLVVVEHGSTEQFRPKAMELEGNRAAVYLFTTPALEEVSPGTDALRGPGTCQPGTPQASLPWERRRTPPHAREGARTRPPGTLKAAGKGKTSREEHQGRAGERGEVTRGPRARRRQEQMAIAVALRERALDLRAISAAAVRAVIRPFLEAGWDTADLVHAIDHAPDGARRTFTSGPTLLARYDHDVEQPTSAQRVERVAAPVASPGAWLTWRLRPWADHQPPAATRRAAVVAAQSAATAAAAARRAENAAAALAATAPPPGFTAVRQALRESARQHRSGVRRPWTPTP